MTASYAGRTVLVTGAGKNIGRSIALFFAKHGANLILVGKSDKQALYHVAEMVKQYGGKAIPIIADVRSETDIQAVVAEATKHFQSIDISIANAAVRKKQSFLDITADDWQSVIGTNLTGAFYLAQAVLPKMIEQQFGRIIHISGMDGFVGRPYYAHNIASKAGLHGLSKALTSEFSCHGITINTVVPGWIETTRNDDNQPGVTRDIQKAQEEIPVRHIGSTEDIANICGFLASEAASYITGQAIHVNGGQAMI